MNFDDLDIGTYLKELETIVNIDSGSNHPEGVAQVADFFMQKYVELGCSVQTFRFAPEIGPCVKVQNRIADRYDVLLLGHMDTVFPMGTTAQRPFRIENNTAYGPGVVDMKSGLLSAYYIIKEFMRTPAHNLSICLLMNSDEEIGSIYSTPWIKEYAAKSKAAFVLEPGRRDGSFIIERKGTAKYEVVFAGIAAHAGVDPEKGRSAITEMAHWIVALDQLNDYAKGGTLNTGIVNAGTAANVVADHAYMKLDARFKNLEQADKIKHTLVEMSGHSFIDGVKANVKQASFREPMIPNSKTLALFGKLQELGERSGVPIRFSATGGASDGNGVASLGVPVIDGFGPVGGNTHSEKEYMDIGSVIPRLSLLSGLMLAL